MSKKPSEKPSLKMAQDNYEARQKEKGLVRCSVWIPKDCKILIHNYGKELRSR